MIHARAVRLEIGTRLYARDVQRAGDDPDPPGITMAVSDWIDPETALMVRWHRINGGGKFSYHANWPRGWHSRASATRATPRPRAGKALWLPAEGIHSCSNSATTIWN